jgi:hypothetical protein
MKEACRAAGLEIWNWNFVTKEFETICNSTVRLYHTTALCEPRTDFLKDFLSKNSTELRCLIRTIKFFNKELVRYTGNVKSINNSALELLVMLLHHNNVFPPNFQYHRAFATCMRAIAYPQETPILLFSKIKNGPDPPSKQQLSLLRQEVGDGRLILVDPFCPFSNFALKRTAGWDVLQREAIEMVAFLDMNSIKPYSLNFKDIF